MKKCSKCGQEKPIENFNFKIESLGKRQSQCKNCTRLYVKNHYNNNKEYYLAKTRKRNKILREGTNSFIRNYLLSHPCIDCGENDPVVLEFDHTGEVQKTKAVSRLIKDQVSIVTIQKEIDKCVVRCANCHRRKTARDNNWFKQMLS